jgi:predicted RNase H-like nuclease (RuvC/YqgF family)
MSEQEVEEQISSDENLNDETGETTETPDKASSNKSNFKKLSEAKKALERELSEAREELESWRSENPELVEKALTKKWSTSEIDEIRTDIFLTKNPEAEQHMEEIKVFTDKWFSLKDAWKYVKPTIITESKSSMDFSIKSNKPVKVDLKSMSMEDAYADWALTKEQRAEWRKIHE